MAVEQVHDLGDAALLDELARCKHELFEARFKLATGQLDDHSSLKKWKTRIARVHTELRDREIAAAEAAAGRAS